MVEEVIASTLLPSAVVDLFLLSDDGIKTAEILDKDWRLARVTLNIEKTGIEAATQKYEDEASPDLVIIEVDDIGDGFLEKLEALAGNCVEGTEAIIVGPENDVELYRKLVGLGVSDYLVSPLDQDKLIGVISKTLINKIGLSDCRLVAVIGSKGGVGTTSVSQILAWDISEKLKQKTMLLDAAGSWGTIGISFGMEPSSTFIEAIRTGTEGSDEDMERMYYKASGRLSLLATGGDPLLEEEINTDDYERLVDRIMLKYPVVVVDLSGASNEVRNRILSRAHEITIVSTPLLPALRGAKTLMVEVKNLRGNSDMVDLVVNMKGIAGASEVPVADIETALDLKTNAVISYEPKIFAEAEASGKPIGGNSKASNIWGELMDISYRAADIGEEDVEGSVKQKSGSLLAKLIGR